MICIAWSFKHFAQNRLTQLLQNKIAWSGWFAQIGTLGASFAESINLRASQLTGNASIPLGISVCARHSGQHIDFACGRPLRPEMQSRPEKTVRCDKQCSGIVLAYEPVWKDVLHYVTFKNTVQNDPVQKVWPHLRNLGFRNVDRQMEHFKSLIQSGTSQGSGKSTRQKDSWQVSPTGVTKEWMKWSIRSEFKTSEKNKSQLLAAFRYFNSNVSCRWIESVLVSPIKFGIFQLFFPCEFSSKAIPKKILSCLKIWWIVHNFFICSREPLDF